MENSIGLKRVNNNQANVFEAFNSTPRYLDELLDIDNPCFEQMVSQIYPTKLQSNKANSSDTEAPFLIWTCLLLMAYDKRDDFNFYISYICLVRRDRGTPSQ